MCWRGFLKKLRTWGRLSVGDSKPEDGSAVSSVTSVGEGRGTGLDVGSAEPTMNLRKTFAVVSGSFWMTISPLQLSVGVRELGVSEAQTRGMPRRWMLVPVTTDLFTVLEHAETVLESKDFFFFH